MSNKSKLSYKNDKFKPDPNVQAQLTAAKEAKQQAAENYWDVDVSKQANVQTFYQPQFQPQYQHQYQPQYQPQAMEFDEVAFKTDPEGYIQNMPPEYLAFFQATMNMQEPDEDDQINEILNDMDIADQNHFEESAKDCKCCKGYIYSCKDRICKGLGKCTCAVAMIMDEDAKEHFIDECKDCKCCRGYVYTCIAPSCKERPTCICFLDE